MTRTALPWWQTWFAIIPGLLLCLPFGLLGLWRRPGTTELIRVTGTVGAVIVLMLAIFMPDDPDGASGDLASAISNDTPTEPPATPAPVPKPTETVEGPVLAEVPEVAGLEMADARDELREAGLTIGSIRRQPSAKPVGTVLRQLERQGSSLEAGSAVALVIAAPFPKVPWVGGDGKLAAIRQLRQAGFGVVTTAVTRTSGEDGVVLRQSPSGGSRVQPGTVVELFIANVVRPVVSPPPSNCTSGYRPCLTPAPDYDCAGGSGDGPAYTGLVYVTGSDPYDLDADGDGVACES